MSSDCQWWCHVHLIDTENPDWKGCCLWRDSVEDSYLRAVVIERDPKQQTQDIMIDGDFFTKPQELREYARVLINAANLFDEIERRQEVQRASS